MITLSLVIYNPAWDLDHRRIAHVLGVGVGLGLGPGAALQCTWGRVRVRVRVRVRLGPGPALRCTWWSYTCSAGTAAPPGQMGRNSGPTPRALHNSRKVLPSAGAGAVTVGLGGCRAAGL